jgi:RNA 2',3'-cyclic 3'-phosphodiesterase
MQKRLFIGISVPDDIKKRIFRLIGKEYNNLPVKWVSQPNFHLTLNFLGYVQEEKIPEICKVVQSAVGDIPSFELNFCEINFGPSREAKKMIWAIGTENKDLENLKYGLDKRLGFIVRDKKKFLPHINLGRIRKTDWQKFSPEPKMERTFNFSFTVSSVGLIESRFEKGKRIYYIMESFLLE